ncbi:MAG: flagellar basal-body MS-ring/collar protein FliF [Pseudotabrizicola sp.]|uniref:flagellar basal-body MS-ring/collar protein FliF n=1 Tax=Pseudotabrizicola sp. TaxID=2939647 RepID=UPI0027157F04|nr:flagellar basal-body MS-ring/collar protein FliF [Pseudotabrizicola sp.]MDO8882510.1 flagellar basal-body MS-ring/collar protein FliF [Pseudotabrizicola sp.]MDP2082087.1 flagellar basal-body MS-ring/collar protein FliF [Pseudotabrizicola sp.]MDZ7576480.1 flagellar basal-body MS-ring/collar protein FliF [Pseudotabrizicola sp.]
MNNLVSLWQGLTLAKRVVLVVATVGMFLSVLALARIGQSGGQSLLYAGLNGRTAGDVITALDQAGVAYEVRGESIYVPTALRDGLRMQLAAQGLPASGGAGYELLDGLSGFGTTSQMFDAAYWRANEGELARTILAMPQIRAARVHIAQGNKSGFLRDQTLTASVTVTTAVGSLSAEQANALRHLVASATGNLKPDDVSVIDSVAGLIAGHSETSALASGDARAVDIKHNVERLLAARVGPGRAVVEVSVDIVRDREAITERTFDPQARVAISSDTEQRSDTSKDGQADVTVASNLPDGDGAGGASGESKSNSSRERVNFEVSQTQRELLREPGAIRRLTVAVLIDGQQELAADGTRTWQARSEAELADLRELVSSAAGLDEARGDVLTLKSLEFQIGPTEGVLAEASFLPQFGPVDVMAVFQILVLSLVSLVLGLFVLRPLLTQRMTEPALTGMAGGGLTLPGPVDMDVSRGLTGEISEGFDLPDLPLVSFDDTGLYSEPTNDPVARLRRLIEERQSESVEILRNWMEKEEERS